MKYVFFFFAVKGFDFSQGNPEFPNALSANLPKRVSLLSSKVLNILEGPFDCVRCCFKFNLDFLMSKIQNESKHHQNVAHMSVSKIGLGSKKIISKNKIK